MNDDAKVLAEQYADAGNLNARIRLHERYSTAEEPWWGWVFDRLDAAVDETLEAPVDETARGQANTSVLEVGCGPGDLWVENAERVPPGWTVVNTDFSPGMLEEFNATTAAVGLSPGPAATAAAEALPFPDDRFDVVVANHVLYHVDRDRALPEIRRVLRPGGHLVATTNGEANVAELRALLDRAGADRTVSSAEFSLQSGPDQLREHFEAVERHDYDGGLQVTDPEPLVAYAASLPGVDDRERAAFAELAAEALADGPLVVQKEQGALVATKEP